MTKLIFVWLSGIITGYCVGLMVEQRHTVNAFRKFNDMLEADFKEFNDKLRELGL